MTTKNPKGTRDLGPNDIGIRNVLINKIIKIFKLYGGVQIDTPVIENMETVANVYGEEFNKQVYKFSSESEELLLRYDLTLPFIRYITNNGLIKMKKYQIGKVYRRDEPNISKGRFREFFQCDFDIVGTDYETYLQDVEMITIMEHVLTELFNGKKDYKIRINNKKLLFDMLTFFGAKEDDFNKICSSLDKLNKMGWTLIKDELKSKEIDLDIIDKIGEFISQYLCNVHNSIDFVTSLYDKKMIQQTTYNEIVTILNHINNLHELDNIIIFDPLLSRGLDYYTGIIYEAEYSDKNIMPSSIAAGGRYDDLIEKLGRYDKIPAIGLSIGLDRIVTILENLNKYEENNTANIFIATVDNNLEIHKLKLANELRRDGISVDYFYTKNPKMRQQMDYVLKNKIKLMIIIGNNEVKNNTISLKNIENKTQNIIDRNKMIEIILTLI